MRTTLRSIVVAALGVLALGAAAATLDSTIIPESSDGEGSGGTPGAFPPPESGPTPGQTLPIPTDLLWILFLLAIAAVIVFALIYWRDTIPFVLAGSILVILLFLVMYVALYFYDGPGFGGPPESFNGSLFDMPGEGGEEEIEAPETTVPPIFMLLVAGLAALGIVAALVSVRSSSRTVVDDEEDETEGPSTAAVGRAAGRAADRLEENVVAENEVYRAWREMTNLLEVPNSVSSTPGEFAAAARAAGMGREDVDELTRLFEDVRYGDTEPSEELEARSVALFRRIEDRYADEDET